MKVSKTFRLSEEAVAVLDKQENMSQYIEDLIVEPGKKTITGPAITEAQVSYMVAKEVAAQLEADKKNRLASPTSKDPLDIPGVTTASEIW